jgi:hypothetical protein
MSIAGIAKEVTTITISAWFFGDELTPLNITGVAITVCGMPNFLVSKYNRIRMIVFAVIQVSRFIRITNTENPSSRRSL